MITFWLICGVFIIIALALIFPPLFQDETLRGQDESTSRESNVSIYKEQLSELEADLANGSIGKDQYDREREEIQRRLLEDVGATDSQHIPVSPSGDKRTAYVLAITLPLLAVGLYLKIGNTNARPAELQDPSASAVGETAGGMSQTQIEANVAALAKRLEANPADLQGWTMLARSYSILGKYDESSRAYERAVALKPRDPELMINYALALAMTKGRNFEGRPQELIQEALSIEPENPNVLALAGGVAFEQKNYTRAIEHWNKLLARVPAESEMAQAVSQKLEEAKSLAAAGKEN